MPKTTVVRALGPCALIMLTPAQHDPMNWTQEEDDTTAGDAESTIRAKSSFRWQGGAITYL